MKRTPKRPAAAGPTAVPTPQPAGPAIHCAHDALVPLAKLKPHPRNPHSHPKAQVAILAKIIAYQGWRSPIVVSKRSGLIVAGHGRLEAARHLGLAAAPVNHQAFASEADEIAHLVADNQIAELADMGEDGLKALLSEMAGLNFDLELMGFDEAALQLLLGSGSNGDEKANAAAASRTLAERFGVAPFSVLNARAGWWQARKQAWIALGIKSELGRIGNLINLSPETLDIGHYAKGRKNGANFDQFSNWQQANGDGIERTITGTSIFDPVLCELLYRWFSPPGGIVYDPFAGGSVRGIVASKLGRAYHGVDLSGAQVEANRDQWLPLGSSPAGAPQEAPISDDPDALTPIQHHGQFWFKRDDLFACNGANGGKVRAMLRLAHGARGVVTACSRISSQAYRLACVAQKLGIPCRVHTPRGVLSREVRLAQERGAEIVQHEAGYNTVIIARAREDAEKSGWVEIPFGAASEEGVECVREQFRGIPDGVKRIVVPTGSGTTLAGVLRGMKETCVSLPVLAVRVGKDPTETLERYAPPGWRETVQFAQSALKYEQDAKDCEFEGVGLDLAYEAKCIPFLLPGDLLWCVGVRQGVSGGGLGEIAPVWYEGNSAKHEMSAGFHADFILSCPPYADLEVYSDHPDDISNMPYAEFVKHYETIIQKSVAYLAEDSFAAWVVSEARDKTGNYYGLVPDTIKLFQKAGMSLYNEAILVTMVASLPVRVSSQFDKGRKLGKTHQNILIFLKGDPKKAVAKLGSCEYADPATVIEEQAAAAVGASMINGAIL